MEVTANESSKRKEINLLEKPHGECHQSVIRGLDQVEAGDSALIIADHDAKPVLYQYQSERGYALDWAYEEEGPEVWKIRVTKGGRREPGQSEFEEFDVREMPPPQRHKSIFEKFDGLRSGQGFVLVNDHDPDRHPSMFHRFGTLTPGESMEIINDHDPRPLYFHFQQTYGDRFSWNYLEQGPDLWRVKITKESGRPKETKTSDAVLDVRSYVPAERHRLIFEKFDQLKPAESFILVNDHDPKPLYYQFAAEHEGEFTWEYLEKGPEAWRVRIGKV